MKATTFLLAFTLIFLFTLPSFSSAFDTVVDSDGDPLKIGDFYYIRPPLLGAGEVNIRDNINEDTCERPIIQEVSVTQRGIPFTFTPTAPLLGQTAIILGAPLSVSSRETFLCEKSTVWKVQPCLGICINPITTGGEHNTPGSCLQIVKPASPRSSNTYVFQNTPSSCGGSDQRNQTINIYQSGNEDFRRLYIGSSFLPTPFEVAFYKELLYGEIKSS